MFAVVAIAFCVFAFVGSSPTKNLKDDVRIVGGYEIDITEAPYQISLMSRGRHSCGGSIIANDLVLTAAHCVVGARPSDYTVRAGSASIRSGGNVVKVAEIIYHEDYSVSNLDNDVALVRLEKPLVFDDSTKAIPLAKGDSEIDDGLMTTVTGWGSLKEGGNLPETLQMVQVPKVNDKDCSEAYQPYYTITARMLCAGIPMGGKDACQGDSGGPLVHDGQLAGIVSWGVGCARPNYPGVYAKVSALRPWIDRNSVFLRAKTILRSIHLE